MAIVPHCRSVGFTGKDVVPLGHGSVVNGILIAELPVLPLSKILSIRPFEAKQVAPFELHIPNTRRKNARWIVAHVTRQFVAGLPKETWNLHVTVWCVAQESCQFNMSLG